MVEKIGRRYINHLLSKPRELENIENLRTNLIISPQNVVREAHNDNPPVVQEGFSFEEKMKRIIVLLLERMCTLGDMYVIDYMPEKLQILWGCRLAEVSARLDERWKTGVWK